LRASPVDANEGCDHFGQKIDFARSKAERIATGDPRASLEERYPNHASYVASIAAAATRLQHARLLLYEDVEAYIKRAQDSQVGDQRARE
jgi:hypothetical protein